MQIYEKKIPPFPNQNFKIFYTIHQNFQKILKIPLKYNFILIGL